MYVTFLVFFRPLSKIGCYGIKPATSRLAVQCHKHRAIAVAITFLSSAAGNNHIHHLTSQRLYQVKVELEDFDGQHAHAQYAYFAVGSEREKFALKLLGKYEGGDAGE